MAGAAAAGGQKEDPIEEDESDVVTARVSVKKPWQRDSSPPRRLHTSMSIQSSTVNQNSSLSTHPRGPGSYATQGKPIIIQRPSQESPSSNGYHGKMKAINSIRFGSFRPQNNLNRPATGQPHPRVANISGLQSGLEEHRKKRRKTRQTTSASEEEDELAGPGVDRSQSSSPTKKRPSSAALSTQTNAHGQIEGNSPPSIGLEESIGMSVRGNDTISDVETLRQKRERKRRQTSLNNQKAKLAETTSPYFGKASGKTHKEQASPIQSSDKPTPHRRDSDLIDVEKSQSLQIPLLPTRDDQIADSKVNRRLSKHQGILRKHEESWHIAEFHSEKYSYDYGSVELIADRQTKILAFRVDGQLKSCRYPMDAIFEAKFDDSVIGLHFRGSRPHYSWIVTKGNAETIMKHLQRLQNFPAKPEKRAERMFVKWSVENRNRAGLSPSKIDDDQHTVSQLSPVDEKPSPNLKRAIVSADDAREQEQIECAREPKRQKLNARMLSEAGLDNQSKPSATPTKQSQPIPALPADIGNTGFSGLVQFRNRLDKPGVVGDVSDITESVEEKATLVTDPKTPTNSTINQAQRPLNQIDKSKTTDREQPIRHSARSTRSNQARYLFEDLEQIMPSNNVQRYSKTHDLGPRWKQPLLWPRHGKKRVTVEFDDLERLDEEQYLNDNLVEFTLRWLRKRVKDPQHIYWFNTYFFERLSKVKGKNIDYDGVKKWTKDVDLFSYDCIVVPINEAHHWYLAIIYNLPQLKKKLDTTTPKDTPDLNEEIGKTSNAREDSTDLELLTQSIQLNSPKATTTFLDRSLFDGIANTGDSLLADETDLKIKNVSKGRGRVRDPLLPTIVTLDSLGSPHPQAVNTLKFYLRAEAQERLGLILEKDDIAGMTAKGVPIQDNFSDCGVYLLGYVAVMLEDPVEFRRKLFQKDFQEKDWEGLQPKHLRDHLRKIIRKKHRQQTERGAKKSVQEASPDELSSDFSSDDIQLLEPSVFLRRPSHPLPPSTDDGHNKENTRAALVSNNGEENITTELTNLHQEKEGFSPAATETHPSNTSFSHAIRVKNFHEPSQPFLDEVPETPQGSPARDVQEAAPSPILIPAAATDQHKDISSSPSTPLSPVSGLSPGSLL